MVRPLKLAPALTPARNTLASTSTSNVFQSFGLKSVDGGGGNIEVNVVEPAPRPRPGAPPARPAFALAGGAGGWIRSIAPPGRVNGSRPPMRPCVSTVTAAGSDAP